MLRLSVLLLICLNTVYFAWGNGWLLAMGWGPMTQTEPQRLGQQINPQAMVLVKTRPVEPSTASPSPDAGIVARPSDPGCLQSPALSAREAQTVRDILQGTLPQALWTLTATPGSERWLIYMGKFESAADVTKKRAQLTALGVKLYPLGNPALAPGVSLGAYPTAETAQQALEDLKPKGVRTARVIQDIAPTASYVLRLPVVDASLQALLPQIQDALAAKTLTSCDGASGALP
ncbi:MAG: SPOR domain-containing protein [Rhodoferax sp.]|jgi:hypothetical protein|nr:SPOR domain-containing protein [Rhodoferax sp.]